MDVVLRTPNGEAEVSVGSGQQDVLLAELVEQVTGRSASQLVYVDGRAVPSATSIGTSGLLNGSTISTVDDEAVPPADGRVELVQVAGVGAGSRTWLSAGRYRLGMGRRMSSAELAHGPVDRPMLELEVDAASSVLVRATAARARLDGVALPSDASTPWASGLIDVGGRVFALGRRDPRTTGVAGHRFGSVGVDGTAAFNRPPRSAPAPPPPPIEVPDDRASSGAGRLAGRGRRASSSAERFAATAAERRRDDIERRRLEHPDLAAAVQLADSVSPELWQRRPGHPDVFHVAIGLANVDWTPELSRGPHAIPAAQSIIDDFGGLPMVPVTVDLLDERGIGVVGGAEFTQSLARGLLIEAAVTHGPADLDVVVLSSPDRVGAWEWVKWLPHARIGGGARIYWTDDQVRGWAAAVRRGWDRPTRPTAPSHLTLVMVDEPAWWRERSAPLRPLFSDASMPLRFVAMTADATDVPAVCTTVVTAHGDDGAIVDYLMDRRRIDGLHGFLASGTLALSTARRLAPLDDPDVPLATESSLPTTVPLLSMLGLDAPTSSAIVSRWARRSAHRLRTVIGLGPRGPLAIDLVEDGPHALIAGTMGSGKSELVRTLVAGLAAELPPDEVNFLLVDFKGESAFGACADLPHTVGSISDLDEHVTSRALRCLRAELRHREQVLTDAGVATLAEYQQLDGVDPLPRLVVVVDEFATVATDISEFVPSLVDLAGRGRALGLHLVLATQRPAGIVDDAIKENADLRIALRVHDDGDSLDVIGTKDAAMLPRRVPGRAYVRIGSGDVTQIQAAHASHVRSDAAAIASGPSRPNVDVEPYAIARDLTPMESRLVRVRADSDGVAAGAPSDLDLLVAAITDAAHEVGQSEQRQPCPEPLPAVIPLGDFFARHPGDAVPYALVDLPDEQRQAPAWWAPGPEGSMVAYGIAGAGTSSLLVTLALGVAERFGPDDVHLYVIDADSNALAPLDVIPHVGAVVRVDEPDRIARLVAHLVGVLDQRKRAALDRGGPAAVVASEPSVVVLVDDLGALRNLLDQRRDLEGVWSQLERVIRDGGPLGICTVVTAKQERAVPPALAAHLPHRLVMQLGEQFGYSAFGLRPAEVPDFVPGRAVRPDDRSELQLVAPPAALGQAIRAVGIEPATERPVRRIDALPPLVFVHDLIDRARSTDRSLIVPVGLDTRTGDPATCTVPFGENAFVTGPPGSGRSSVLAAFAMACRRAAPDVEVFALAPRRGPLTAVDGVDRLTDPTDAPSWAERIATRAGRRLVLIDDADRLAGEAFERLAGLRDEELIVVVAGHADELRHPGHWSKPLQRFRNGVLLRPGPADGDLVRVSLGARLPHFAPHRGFLVVDGEQIPLLAAVVRDRSSSATDSGGESA